MLFSDALFGDAFDLEFLALAELAKDRPFAFVVVNDGGSAGAAVGDDEVPGVNGHVVFAGAFCGEGERDGAGLAEAVAVAVAGVDELVVDLGGVEGDEAQAVGEELVGEDGGVDGYFD